MCWLGVREDACGAGRQQYTGSRCTVVQPQRKWCELQIGHPVAVHFATVRDPQKRSVQQELLRPPRRIRLKGLKDRDNGVAIKKRSCTKGTCRAMCLISSLS